MSKTEASIENIYRLEGRVPVAKAIPFGLQHILAMFVANIAPIIIVAAACGLSASESAGLGRDATTKETSGSIACDGFVSALSSVFGCLPITSFSQNVGLVAMTKMVNRKALACGALFLILCGLCPKLAAVISIMPQSVLGGAAVIMFASIVVSGIQLITRDPLTSRNLSIVSVALGLGYGIGANPAVLAGAPEMVSLIFGGSGIVAAAAVAILLNIVLPKDSALLKKDSDN